MNYQPLVQNFRYITIFDKWSCIYIYREREAIVLVTSNSLRTGSWLVHLFFFWSIPIKTLIWFSAVKTVKWPAGLTYIVYTGWWFQPLWKIWSQLGLLFPIYGKIKNVPTSIYNTGVFRMVITNWDRLNSNNLVGWNLWEYPKIHWFRTSCSHRNGHVPWDKLTQRSDCCWVPLSVFSVVLQLLPAISLVQIMISSAVNPIISHRLTNPKWGRTNHPIIRGY